MICLIAGARPNFMKIAPLYRELRRNKIITTFCHTLQHKDNNMSHHFIKEFGLPKPDYYGAENIPEETELAIVVGDVNSSLQAARTVKEKGITLAHVEAGLRSFDDDMPEEHNRKAIDKISDYLFVTEISGVNNLKNEGITKNVFLVGNVMIDTLLNHFGRYILLTLHRPSNVDKRLDDILEMMDSIGTKVLYPVHPRVVINKKYKNINTTQPLSYFNFITAMKKSCLVVTDSGGVQEEAVVLGKKCITLRKNTERPITLDYGNKLVFDLDEAKKVITDSVNIPLWDGKATKRIVEILMKELKCCVTE